MADWMVSGVGLGDASVRTTVISRALRVSWSLGSMFRCAGKGGRDGLIVMPFEGEDSASKRAWRTAESLVVRFGFVGEIVVEAIFFFFLSSFFFFF